MADFMDNLRLDDDIRDLYVEICFATNTSRKKRKKGYTSGLTESIDFDGHRWHRGIATSRDKHLVTIDWDSGSVDVKYHCCGLKSQNVPTNCVCRHVAFTRHRFVDCLVVLHQLRCLRTVLVEDANEARQRELFNAIFGVTNVSSMKVDGTRGLHFFFHSRKSLGSFCMNAMHVLLGADAWVLFSSRFVCDKHRLRSVNNSPVAGRAWFVGKKTHESYSQIDSLVGYSVYLHEGKGVGSSVPARGELARFVAESGLHQQPYQPKVNTTRKAKGLREYLLQHAGDYFLVGNPSCDNGALFRVFGEGCDDVWSGFDGVKHQCDVVCFALNQRAQDSVEFLKDYFSVLYGADGHLDRAGGDKSLQPMNGCDSVRYWCSGNIGSCSPDLVSGIFLNGLVNQIGAVVKKYGFHGVGVSLYAAMCFKVNRFSGDGVRVQLPHLVLDPASQMKLREQGAVAARVIVGLDNAGLVLRIWPKGFPSRRGLNAEDKLVYLPPGCALVLPLTVATSDCIRFSPQGQKRLEFVFVGTEKDACGGLKSDALAFNGTSFYLDSIPGQGRRYCCLGDEREREFYSSAIEQFVKLFEF